MPDLLEILGFAASLIVLVSLLMSSLKKLRWINLVGALLFGVYGFMIGSLPTGFMNLGIVIIDIYYLVKMYGNKDFFQLLPIKRESEYLDKFIEFYDEDIQLYGHLDKDKIKTAQFKYFIHRNMAPAGIFIAKEEDKTSGSLRIELDYVVPQYRDFKLGSYLFDTKQDEFQKLGYKEYIVTTENKDHIRYIKKMGFTFDQERQVYSKAI